MKLPFFNRNSFLVTLFQKFQRDDGSTLAAAIAFNFTLCAIPLTLLLVSFLGYIFIGSEVVSRQILLFFDRAIPNAIPQVVEELEKVVNHRGVIGLLGLVSLLWTSTRFFGSLRQALNRIFEVEKSPGIIVRKFIDFFLLILVGLFFLLTIAITSLFTALKKWVLQYGSFGSKEFGLWKNILGFGIPFLLTVFTLFILYQVALYQKLKIRTCLIAALSISILWEFAKQAYAFYLVNAGLWGRVYGSVGVFVMFLLWIYYSALVFVIGGEIAWVLEKKRKQGL